MRRPACRRPPGTGATGRVRRHRSQPWSGTPERAQPRALASAERAAIWAALHSERFADTAPAEAWATLLDQDPCITADEFDRRSTLALTARTGEELTAPLADLPLDRGPVDAAAADTATPRRADSYLVPRLTIGASLTAICFGGVAVTTALRPGVDWTVALTPAAVAVLCVILVTVLRVRARRGPLLDRQGQPGR